MTPNSVVHPSVHSLIAERRSTRVFDPQRPLTREQTHSLLEAARWAPSGGNRQPWRYIVFDQQNLQSLQKARQCLSASNQLWATRVPVLILAATQMIREDGKANPKGQHDLGLANEHILLQAISMGLCCRPFGGFDAVKAREYFNIPAEFEPIIMIAVGYPGAIEELPESVQKDERELRQRKEVSEFTFYGAWDQSKP